VSSQVTDQCARGTDCHELTRGCWERRCRYGNRHDNRRFLPARSMD